MPPEGAHNESPVLTVTGMVEGLEGRALIGWAIDPARPHPCHIAVTDAQDRLLATTEATSARPDLAIYGYPHTGFGFRLVLDRIDHTPRLHVYADGAELTGSPIETGPAWLDGVLAVVGGHAEGWVQPRTAGTATIHVALHDQEGVPIGEAEALPADPAPDGFAPARFRIPLDASIFRHTELALRATADGHAFAHTRTPLTLRGGLDALGPDGARGWVRCLEIPALPLDIELRIDGVLAATQRADRAREELRAPFPEHWHAGFDIVLEPDLHPAPGPRLFSLRIAGCPAELFDGPLLVAEPSGFIAAARRLAARPWTDDALSATDAAVLQAALGDYITACRENRAPRARAPRTHAPPAALRFTVAIPVYRDVAVTRDCIESVLAHRDPATDALLLIDDASPDAEMAPMLAEYEHLPNVTVLTNLANRGFVGTANRAMAFCRAGDIILLNSDTRVFAGSLAALHRAAHSAPDIGSATALSNNATIFSYPFTDRPTVRLDDMDWQQVAAHALAGNEGLAIDVPTGHGFCLLLRRHLLDRVGALDEVFGRGYGEENDLCLRAMDAGLRSVAAAAAFVEHREAVSFGADKPALLRRNLQILERRYPEYAADVRAFIDADGLRAARWAIDAARLAAAPDRRHVLVLGNWLLGGSQKAIDDIAEAVGYGTAVPLHLGITKPGRIELVCADPPIRAVFLPQDLPALFRLLSSLSIEAVLIHQLLGHQQVFIEQLEAWSRHLRRFYYLHDFYPVCPRVTLIDASERFCGVPDASVCDRCVALGGVHEAARMNGISVAEHRARFAGLLGAMDAVIAPSADAAAWLARGLPEVAVTIVPHPEPAGAFDVPAPAAIGPDVVLLGAIGPHKGAGALLQVASLAALAAPALRFHVIGYTDRNDELRALGNVRVHGPYDPPQLPDLVRGTGAAMALFLHQWPETYSYTLSEAVHLGLVPLVPDLGAPAARVRAAGFGHVFGFPVDPAEVVAALQGLRTGILSPGPGTPAAYATPLHPAYAGGALLPVLARPPAPWP